MAVKILLQMVGGYLGGGCFVCCFDEESLHLFPGTWESYCNVARWKVSSMKVKWPPVHVVTPTCRVPVTQENRTVLASRPPHHITSRPELSSTRSASLVSLFTLLRVK